MGHRTATPAWVRDAERIDVALYAAVATTPTPALDRAVRRLTTAADHSRLSLAAAAVLAVARGARGRRAARLGIASIAVTSATVNVAIKPLARRRRPDTRGVPLSRHVPMPASRSFPSGHAASAFAFATAVGHVLPRHALALRVLAAAVGYSRVHAGVHFPGDVLLGGLLGTSTAQLTVYALERRATT
jgi:membrane-associated phospholipid phosphatase